MKKLCDYDNPLLVIALEQITTGRLHSLLFIDVDKGRVIEVESETYSESVLATYNDIRES